MALVEGVGRMLDPEMDIWTIAEPIVGDWIKDQAGPKGKLAEAGEHLQTMINTLGQVPELVERANGLLAAHKGELERQKKQNYWGLKLAFGTLLGLLMILIWRVW